MVARSRTVWRCQDCGYGASRWMGRCPDCGEFDTFAEETTEPSAKTEGHRPAVSPVALADVIVSEEARIRTGLDEFDRVLGGGLVAGSLVLLGGQPGIGKSTLLLQTADALAHSGHTVMYVCGEESPAQVKMRAERLKASADGLLLLPEVDIAVVEATVTKIDPVVLVVDSIQTVFDPDLSSTPGSVGQVRACTARLMRMAKDQGVTIVVVGHVTKEGAIAGPRVLEHIVDTVLYFEGDRDHAFRVVRAVKNRFGSVSEIGIFEMTEEGLLGVGSPSEVLLSRRDTGVAGSVVMATMEGSRPLLVEIQALVTPSYLDMSRRLATGIDRNRVLQIIAVLERHADVSFSQHDVYVSAAGGVRITEPAVDLPLALALTSARRDTAIPCGVVAFGEIGLTGEVRPVPGVDLRLSEAASMGMRITITGGIDTDVISGDLEVLSSHTILDALSILD